MSFSSPLSAFGLILDVAGAVVLALGLMLKRPDHWYEETLTLPGNNGRLFLGLAIQTADVQVGASLLTAGFVGQLLPSVGVGASWLSLCVACAAAVVVDIAAVLFLFAYWRPRNIRRALALWIQTVEHGEWRIRLDEWAMWLDKYPIAFVLWPRRWQRRRGDSMDDFGRRFFGRKRWERLTNRFGVPPFLRGS